MITHLAFIESARMFMKKLTPIQFQNLFPLKKEYDGGKYGFKDYFYSADKLKQYDSTQPIGDHLDDLLWEYLNDHICEFVVSYLSTMSKLRQLSGEKGIAEKWAEESGLETYTLFDKEGYLINNATHEAIPYKKPKPQYLQLVK